MANIDESEAISTTVNSKLQRCVLRMAFGYFGHSDRLDNALTELGNLVRTGERGERLDDAVSQVADAILEIRITPNQDSQRPAGNPILDLVSRLDWPDSSADSSSAFKERIKTWGQQLDEATLVNELADLLQHSWQELQDLGDVDATQDHGPVLAQICRRLSDHAGDGASTARLDEIAEQIESHEQQAEQLRQLLSVIGAMAWAPGGEGSEAGRLFVLHLLERISLPETFDERVGAIKKVLADHDHDFNAEVALEEMASLLRDMQSHLRQESKRIGEYLKKVLLRVQSLQMHLMQAKSVRDSSLGDAEDLQRLIDMHISGVRASLDESEDVETLRELVTSALDSVDSDLNRFIDSERERHAMANKTMEDLAVQLGNLESEADRLRHRIRQERDKALTDSLTGLANRLSFDEKVQSAFEQWQDESTPTSLVVVDIDFFKKINDRFGHQAGDRVLQAVAQKMRECIRRSDFLCRYGGEEFVLVLPGSSTDEAHAVAEKLRHSIEGCQFRYNEEQVPVTVSCGVTVFASGDNIEAVFERADSALYRAKESGRNQVVTDFPAEEVSLSLP